MKLETRIARLKPGELLVIPLGELLAFDFKTGRTPPKSQQGDMKVTRDVRCTEPAGTHEGD